MRSRRLVLLTFPMLLATAACERTPGDPLDSDLATLVRNGGEHPDALTLPGLVYAAIRGVYMDQGASAARDLVQDLALIQYRLDQAPVEERARLRRELRQEQLRIVLLVHGRDVIGRTIDGVGREAARLQHRRDALAASGIAAPEVSAVLEQLPALIDTARNAANDNAALDAATRAAGMIDRMREAVAGAARLPSLTELFDNAAAHLGNDAFVVESRALRDAADDAVRSGDRARAVTAVKAARDAQIAVVLTALGPDAVADVIGWGQESARAQKIRLEAAAATRDVSRLERMNVSAEDMLQRADLRLRRGDAAGALDLAAHAVDLLNALDATLTSF